MGIKERKKVKGGEEIEWLGRGREKDGREIKEEEGRVMCVLIQHSNIMCIFLSLLFLISFLSFPSFSPSLLPFFSFFPCFPSLLTISSFLSFLPSIPSPFHPFFHFSLSSNQNPNFLLPPTYTLQFLSFPISGISQFMHRNDSPFKDMKVEV